jgi:MioC protein
MDDPTKTRIFYATVSGTARLVAEAIALGNGTKVVSVTDLGEADADEILAPSESTTLFCIATTGSGNMPDDALALYNKLADAPRYLGDFRYGLIALGDSSYGTTFCGGGLMLDTMFQDLGAKRIGETLQIDAIETDNPEQAAADWFMHWHQLL